MEVPLHLKTLYRHWGLHTEKPKQTLNNPRANPEVLDAMCWFIEERMRIWELKTKNSPLPYSEDSVLSRYRFCNIFRELDRQTIEFHTLLNPLRNDFPLWLLNMFYCRMVARPETIHSVGLLSYDTREYDSLYKQLTTTPRPRFGTPYVFPVSVIQKSEFSTRELFIAYFLPKIMKRVAAEILSHKESDVCTLVEDIVPVFGFNLNFLWTEVLIDVAYQFPEHVTLFGRFPVGPGAMPTLQRLFPGHDPSLAVVALAGKGVTTELTYDGRPLFLSAENWEGIGCEYRKYTNLKKGKGRKRIFLKNG